MGHDESLGQLVRQERRALDLTQEELARRVGCAAITIRKIEAGDLRPSQQIAERLALALAIPPKDRADFVRQARSVQPGGRPSEPTPTPQVMPEEIGLEDLSGRAIRGYTLGARIGAGSFGAVYRGVQPLVEREVAIKIILPQYANHPDFIRRFEAEAQLVARLEHPHIVPLYDYWREPGVAYLVMRLLRGGSVHDLIEHGPLPLDQTAHLVEHMCAALHAAHRAGVVHRDLKPSNVLLDEDGNAYLADFGIAKNLGAPEAQTPADMVIGSPAYLSPEQALSEPVRPQTDIYSLGVMLYEMLTGAKPFTGPTPILLMQQHLYAPMPPLAAHRSGLSAAFDDIIAHATAKDPLQRYSEVDALLADFNQVVQTGRLAATITLPPTTCEPIEIVNPYKGLHPFEEADAPDFFGREALTQQLLARLGEGGDLNRFLAVVGPSGCGKSSVVGAGLIPALRRGGLPHSENWFIVEVLPGSHPLEELEAALLRVAVNPPESLLAQIKEDRRGLLRAIQRALPADPNIELVLVLDQFEEVFTLVADEAERSHLLDSLVTTVLDERSRARVIVTLRADFIDKPLRYMDFGELMQRRSELVLPLTPDEMERAIGGPAERVGLCLEAGLPEAISADVNDQPGALPLMQYALTELFERRIDHTLTKVAYHNLGGVKGALGRRAEEVYQALSENDRALTRQIFLRLVTLGEGVEDTRRRVLLAELEALNPTLTPSPSPRRGEGEMAAVLDAFGKARLLSFDRDLQTRGSTIEVAHEALLREWPRLREWLSESRSDVRLQRLLANEVAEWLKADREDSFLLRGSRLQQFEDWAKTTSMALTNDERAYLEASLDERERQRLAEEQRRTHEAKLEHRAKRVLQGLFAVAVIAAIISGALALIAANREQEAQVQRQEAVAQKQEAETQRQEAVNQKQEAETQRQLAETQKQEALRQASIGLAAQAVAELQGTSPERGTLLALEALENYPYTPQAERALAQAVSESKPYVDLDTNFLESYPVNAVWLSDGKRLAVGYADRTGQVFVMDVDANRVVNRLTGTTGTDRDCGILAMDRSPVDDRLVIVPRTKPGITCYQPSIWDLKTNTAVLTLTNPISAAVSAAWAHDGQRILTTHADGTARVWNAQDGTELRVLSGHTGSAQDAAWSPTDDQIATASQDRTAKVWDAITGQEVITLTGHANTVTALSWSPDGKRVATASADGTGRVWDAVSGRVLFVLTGHTAGLLDIAWSSDGRLLATSSSDGTSRIWDAATGVSLSVLRGLALSRADLAWSPIDQRLAIMGGILPRVWDLSEKSLILPTVNTDRASTARWSPDGSKIASSSYDGTARVFEAASGKQLLILQHPVYLVTFAWSPDSQRLVTAGGDGVSRIWDAQTGKLVQEHSESTKSVAFAAGWSPDGSRIATSYWPADIVEVWDVATSKTLFTLGDGTCDMHIPSWSPQGDRLATGCWYTPEDDNLPAEIWDGKTGQLLMTLESHDGETYREVWSPDGKRLAVTYGSGPVKIWDATTGQELLTLVGHNTVVWEATWSPDGRRIASGDQAGNVKVWEVNTGQEVMNFKAPGFVRGLDWSDDGQYLLVSGMFNTPFIKRVWQSTDELIQYAKECCVLRELTAAERQQFGLATK
jgi:WD40 repeat protein/serine/threonine protein kinase/DNA-binding XRE family transcriptional regulator